jgi:hypothetical protein
VKLGNRFMIESGSTDGRFALTMDFDSIAR